MAALVFWSVIGCNHLIKKHRNNRTYKYSSISPARRETRVLTLTSGSFLDELKGEIHTISLDDTPASRIQYEAVSYARGTSSSKPDHVRVGAGAGRKLTLPYNVGQALRHLRYHDRPRTLWLDIVSIHQDDPKEKARQVAMMADIYQQAYRVVVWLGPRANESNTAMTLLHDLGWMVEFDFENARMRPSPAGAVDPSWADPTEYLPYEQDELWSIYELVHRSWFSRVWARLEIDGANPATALVVCGNKTITWDLLRTALACIANKPRHYLDRSEESSPELRFARRYELVLLLCQAGRDYSLLDLLNQGRKFSCSDPRDRVYAALDMAADVDASLGLPVDYTRTKTQVYQDLALRYMTLSKSTNMLASCEATASARTTGGGGSGSGSMPSWIPDWSLKRIANTLPMHLASSLSDAQVRHNGSDVLRASCVRCATVATATELFGEFVPTADVIAAIRRCAPADVLAGAAYRGSTGPDGLLRAYCATLAWGLFDTTYMPPVEAYPDVDVSVESLRLVLEVDAAGTAPDKENDKSKDKDTEGKPRAASSATYDFATLAYITHLLGTCKGRTFFTTEEGYIGLGPRETKAGDQVFVVLGCDVPLVLRQRLDSKYDVVGDSYVHGLMTGEALLGPLPEGWRMVFDVGALDDGDELDAAGALFVYDGEGPVGGVGGAAAADDGQRATGSSTPGETRGSTTTTTAVDPRWEALSARISNRGEKTVQITPEQMLTPAALKAAGVDVVDVNLG